MDACRQCPDVCPLRVLALAAVVALVVLLVWWVACTCGVRREGFVSQQAREVYQHARKLFTRSRGEATHAEFKAATKQTDPVLFTDVRNLWRGGDLTPENVQNAL